ncbi:MAG: hypothetical protein KKE20_05875 [Nanoarchaeota archaeon]|nr:hypothetical protein [Nanoarchaeota archaeon]
MMENQAGQLGIDGFDVLLMEVPAMIAAEDNSPDNYHADLVRRCSASAEKMNLTNTEIRVLEIAARVLGNPSYYDSMSQQMIAVRAGLSKEAGYFVDHTLAEVANGNLDNLPHSISGIIKREALSISHQGAPCNKDAYHLYLM